MPSEWATALENLLQSEGEEIPAGWLTYQAVASELGLSDDRTRKRIKQMLDHNIAECRDFRIPTKAGVRQIPHYRLVANASAATE